VGFNQRKFFKRLAHKAGVHESKFMLPYLIGAQFGGAVGFTILQSPLSIESDIDLAITMVILLMICGLVDLGGALGRLFAGRFAYSANPSL
jgi:hypothetical protein